MSVIDIRTSEDSPTQAQNKLRYAIELGIWRREWREAEAAQDFERMDRLNETFDRVGLP
jgi:hypothetical protein